MMTRKFNLLLSLLGVLVTSTAYPQAARTVMVQSNNAALLYPTNLWSANAPQARAGLGLGSAATNPASAFQPASSALSNIITGQFSSAITFSGTNAAANAAASRTNLGLGESNQVYIGNLVLSDTNGISFDEAAAADNTRTNLGLGTFKTTSDDSFSEIYSGSDLRIVASDIITFYEAFDFIGTNAANYKSQSRIALGLPLPALTNTNNANFRTAIGLGATWLTNSNVTNFRTAIGLGETNDVVLQSVTFGLDLTNALIVTVDNQGLFLGTEQTNTAFSAINFNGAGSSRLAANTRTNLGLGATWLTNTDGGVSFLDEVFGGTNEFVNWANTNLVVSNAATTRLEDLDGDENSDAFYFESTFTGSEWNVPYPAAFRQAIGLPLAALTNTNAANFRTAIELGSSDSPIFEKIFLFNTESSIGRYNWEYVGTGAQGGITFGVVSGDGLQAISIGRNSEELIIFSNSIFFNGSQSWVTNETYRATTRTNLGLGWSALTNTNAANFRTAVGLGSTNNVTFNSADFTDDATTRTNLRLRWTGLTNTNSSTFQGALFPATNAAPFNLTNVAAWVDIRVGNTTYKVPLYQ